jgi:hypothetical protein
MLYNTQNLLDFFSFFFFYFSHLPVFLETRKHDVSETGSVSETLCILVSRTPGDGKCPKLGNSELDQGFPVVFLGPRASVVSVLKFHLALLASHCALPQLTPKYRPSESKVNG